MRRDVTATDPAYVPRPTRVRPTEISALGAAAHFARLLLLADLSNVVLFAISLSAPLFVLTLFMVIGDRTMLAFLFPGMVAFTLILFGGWPALRITLWQQQGMLQRLACTPTPLGFVVLGAGFAQIVVSVVQAVAVLAFGSFVLKLPVSLPRVALALPLLVVGAACFIALGALTACVARRVETVNAIYMFVVLPLAFLGNTILPPDALPAWVSHVRPFLPTGMLTRLIALALSGGAWTSGALRDLLGLTAFALVFATLSVKVFRRR